MNSHISFAIFIRNVVLLWLLSLYSSYAQDLNNWQVSILVDPFQQTERCLVNQGENTTGELSFGFVGQGIQRSVVAFQQSFGGREALAPEVARFTFDGAQVRYLNEFSGYFDFVSKLFESEQAFLDGKANNSFLPDSGLSLDLINLSAALRALDNCTQTIGVDFDGDGRPDTLELIESTDPTFRDNDIFQNIRLFVEQQYRDFLQRESDIEGTTFWVNEINNEALTIFDMYVAFLFSDEFQNQVTVRFPGLSENEVFITALYLGMLQRDPDRPGFDFWLTEFNQGRPIQDMVAAFYVSPEYFNRFLQ